MSKIALGTVQFGLDYGIANNQGRVQNEETEHILKYAQENGISILDTAAAYGESEQTLGCILKSQSHDFNIVTKVPHCSKNMIKEHVFQSMNKLQSKQIYGVLFHSFKALKDDFSKWDIFKEFKKTETVNKIGVSLYHPEEWIELKEKNIIPDIIQFPFSIFDNRFIPYLSEMKTYGIELHIRSVFLQGLYFMNPGNLPEFFSPARKNLFQLQQYGCKNKIPMASLCLNYAHAFNEIDYILIGVDSLKQLKENMSLLNSNKKDVERLKKDLSQFTLSDKRMVLPYLWPQK